MTKKNTKFKQNVTNRKEELRIWAKNIRKSSSFQLFDEKIINNIKTTNTYTTSQNVMLFYPLPYEINLLPLLEDNKIFSFPSIINNEIMPLIYNGNFTKGEFNVQEPLNSTTQALTELDLVIAPALCVDNNGYRIGYGKGFYDKFIKKLNRSTTKLLAPIYNNLLVNDIEPDIFDEKVDFIVTENTIIEL